jgi:hypothetical protein
MREEFDLLVIVLSLRIRVLGSFLISSQAASRFRLINVNCRIQISNET